MASGIVLIAAILILTGLVAGHLHEQAVATTEGELARLDTVLAESSGRAFRSSETVLQTVSDRLRRQAGAGSTGFAEAMTAPEIAETLGTGLGATSPLAALALIDPDGTVLNTAGWWPIAAANVGDRDFFAVPSAQPQLKSFVGAPVEDPRTGGVLIPFARRIADGADKTLGFIVGALPAADFEAFFRAVPLGEDGSISLVRRDGLVLAQYPRRAGAIGSVTPSERLLALLAEGSTRTIHDASRGDGQWRIEAVQALAAYPVAIVIGRGGETALDDWSRQAVWFAGFAVFGALAIAMMVYLIARQFRTHAALASVRAEKIQMEHARLLAEAELLKKDRLSVLGQLTATVAHELRNPLSAIRNTLFSVKEMATGAGVKLDRPIARMERSIDRCNRIIGDLLEYARTRELRCAAVGFDHWLGEVLSEQSLPATVSLVTDFGAPDAMVMIDGERVRRVVINLIDNAAQALGEMPPDGGERRITVRTAIADGAVELAVEDTGTGITPENLARIFEPLFSTKSFGTGLGLATVKQIVGQHGGYIDVNSEVGRGTRFTVSLPLGEEVKVAA